MQTPTPITPLENRLQEALSNALDRLEALEPDVRYSDARQVLAQAAQRQMQEAGRDPDPDFDEANDVLRAGEILDILNAALRQFGGPLRLATICLEQASNADLDALSRHHTLDLATAVDDWKTRAETRLVAIEREAQS